jgi:GntR family transcriptional regulator, transcriptional repressor for pyruvate dehydrogenase complex
MARDSRVDETVDALLRAVVSGDFSTDRQLPSQGELAASLSVSRLTVREAIKELKTGNVLRVEHGNGTFVNPPGAWTDLDALAQMSRAGTDGLKTSQALIEVRRIIEVGAAELCATRRTAQDVAALRHHVQAMTEARDESDVEAFVNHDLAFHATVLRGCANPFLAAVYDPLLKILQQARTETSAFPAIRDNALEHHRAILAAVADRAPTRARVAMDAHIEQTSRDLAAYVGGLAEA